MTSDPTSDPPHATSPQRRVRWGVTLPGSAFVALLVVLGLAVADTAQAESNAEMAHLTLGAPLGWLTQDQSGFDPPFPATSQFASLWEHPVSVELLPMLLDVALVMSVLLAGWLLVGVVWSRRSS